MSRLLNGLVRGGLVSVALACGVVGFWAGVVAVAAAVALRSSWH